MRKNRLAAAGIAAFILAVPLSGCGEKSPESCLNPKSPVTVTVWHYYNGVQQTMFNEMVSEFNETVGIEKGIIVEAFSKSSIDELSDAVLNSVRGDAGAETPPDIFATYSETAYTVDKLGKLADLKQYLTEEEISAYVDEYMNEGDISGDNTLKIFPTAKSTEIMMINKTDWEKFASSEEVTLDDLKTIEGVVSTAEKYYNYTDALTPDIKDDGKAFFGRDSVANYMYIGGKMLGTEYVDVAEDGSGTVNADKTAVKKLWDNYYVPYVKGYFTAESRYRSDDMKTNAIIAMICSTTGAPYFPSEVTLSDDSTYPIESVIIPCPYFDGTEPYLVQQGAGMSVIKSDEANEYASIVFLKWFTEEERNIRFSMGSGYLPVMKSANSYDKIAQINDTLDSPVDDIMLRTFETAIGDINSRPLYISAPFDKSAETRNYIGNTMADTASAAFAQVKKRTDAGEDRSAVIAELTSDAAFDAWYDSFISGLSETVSGGAE